MLLKPHRHWAVEVTWPLIEVRISHSTKRWGFYVFSVGFHFYYCWTAFLFKSVAFESSVKRKKNMRDCFTALFQPLRLALPFNKRETE